MFLEKTTGRGADLSRIRSFLITAAVVAVAGVLVSPALSDTGETAYGVSAANGCNAPTYVNDPVKCVYVFQNETAFVPPEVPSGDTVLVTSAVNDATNHGSSGEILPNLHLILSGG